MAIPPQNGAREKLNADLIAACARTDIDVRSHEARQRLAAFGEGMEAVRRDIRGGRSLGHIVLAAVMLDGGLVHHYERQRDTSANAAARRDAERVLEELRSLCRAAQAFEQQHGVLASLGDFLEHAAGLHAQELGAGEDRRVTISTIHRAKGTEATLVILIGCEEQLLPSWQSLASPDPEALCEERRLFYVAATRAKDRLILTRVAPEAGATRVDPRGSWSRPGSTREEPPWRRETRVAIRVRLQRRGASARSPARTWKPQHGLAHAGRKACDRTKAGLSLRCRIGRERQSRRTCLSGVKRVPP